MTQVLETEVLVVGAGPVGLYQAFQLGLLEVGCHVVDALPYAGGQPRQLYPDKPIYDIPGIVATSGRDLAQSLLIQLSPLQVPLHLGHIIRSLQIDEDGRFLLASHLGLQWRASRVVLACGVGAFEPKRVKLDGIDAAEGRNLSYWPRDDVPLSGRHVVILGGETQALQTATDLARLPVDRAPAAVTVVHRRDGFKTDGNTEADFRALCQSGNIRFVVGQPTACTLSDQNNVTSLQITSPTLEVIDLVPDELWSLQGLSPALGPISTWGLSMERKLLCVDNARMETSQTGIHAVGDVNTYPGKRKLLVCGFHECVLAAFAIAESLRPDAPPLLQYTTTSPRLQELLGVKPPAA